MKFKNPLVAGIFIGVVISLISGLVWSVAGNNDNGHGATTEDIVRLEDQSYANISVVDAKLDQLVEQVKDLSTTTTVADTTPPTTDVAITVPSTIV